MSNWKDNQKRALTLREMEAEIEDLPYTDPNDVAIILPE